MDEEYFDAILRGGPIPGSSLTSDPDDPAPYEKPPQFVDVHSASEWIFSELIDEDRYDPLIQSLLEGIPVMDVVQVILFTGFTQGKWDVNLMTLLIEPTAYIIMALAERAGIDPVIYRGEAEDDAKEEIFFGNKMNEEKTERIKKFKELGVRLPFISQEDQNKLDSLPTAEEMDLKPKTPQEEEEEVSPSLLAEPENEV
jgi:hypothetical protein